LVVECTTTSAPVRRGERVVDDDERAGRVADLGQFGHVADLHEGVRGRLEPEDLGLARDDCLRDGLKVHHLDGVILDTPAPEDAVDESVRSAVDIVAQHHMVAWFEHGAQQRVFRGEARREREPVLRALERGQQGLERRPGGVAAARVLVTAAETADAVLHEGRRLVDRRDDGAGRRIELLSGVHGGGLELLLLLGHDYSQLGGAAEYSVRPWIGGLGLR
jgi:hypothetical protein